MVKEHRDNTAMAQVTLGQHVLKEGGTPSNINVGHFAENHM